ncbi:MAG: hypothetical protein PHG63_03640 [Candidatus Dojkabacteria bacterium]|nr:hypothetical protein [Candidatus Dojkabacteria bacterium]
MNLLTFIPKHIKKSKPVVYSLVAITIASVLILLSLLVFREKNTVQETAGPRESSGIEGFNGSQKTSGPQEIGTFHESTAVQGNDSLPENGFLKDIRDILYKPQRLTVTLIPETIRQGESYQLEVKNPDGSNYTGYLDFSLRLCDYYNPQNCSDHAGRWSDHYVQDGSVTVTTDKTFGLNYYYVRFRPSRSNVDWSNEVLSKVVPYQMDTFWNLKSGNYWMFEGTNNCLYNSDFTTCSYFPSPRTFTSKVEIETPENVCGTNTLPWRLTKSEEYGYWAPNNENIHHRWFLVPFEKQSNWETEFLWSKGYKVYTRDSANPFSSLVQFSEPSMQYGVHMTTKEQYRALYPPYILSPKQLNLGWSFKGSREQSMFEYFVHPFSEDFCKEYAMPEKCKENQCDRVWGSNSWSVDYARVNVETPVYKGPAIRIRFFEVNLREDWYLAEGIGLVKIAAKYFPKNVVFSIDDCSKLNPPDPDCTGHEIAHPSVELKLKEAYLGEKLDVSISPTVVQKGGTYTTTVRYRSTPLMRTFNYRGFLKVKINNSAEYFLNNAYIENGSHIFVSTPVPGLYNMQFRRWIPANDATNVLPWSDVDSIAVQ